MPAIFLGWMLLLWPGGANFQVPMASQAACMKAAAAAAQQGLTKRAYCLNTQTGEFLAP